MKLIDITNRFGHNITNKETIYTSAMMPISVDIRYYHNLLFELNNPVILPADMFNEVYLFLLMRM